MARKEAIRQPIQRRPAGTMAGHPTNDPEYHNSKQTPLHWAGRNGTPQTVSRLLHHGADMDDLANLGSPLHYAAGSNGYDTVEKLINNQANMDRRDANEGTPLHWAAR